MPKRDAAHMDARRHQIMDALQESIRKKGIASTSIQDVAAEAGLSIGAIYVHFDSKDAILLAAVRRSNGLMESGEYFRQFGDPPEFWPAMDKLLLQYEKLQHASHRGSNLELMLVARNDPRLREEIEIAQQLTFGFVRRCLSHLAGAARLKRAQMDALAAGVTAILTDAGIRALVGMNVQRTLKRRAMRLLVESVLPRTAGART